jgi:hypothetical protein
VREVIDARGHSPALSIVTEIVDVDDLCLATPSLTGILEVADQLLLLGIYADHRVSCGHEESFHSFDVSKLMIPIGVRWT